MTIANNANIWINGSDQLYFTYEGGTTLYHFCPSNCGIFTGIVVCNIIFFADNEEHALDVIKRMLTFMQSQTYDGYRSDYVKKRIQEIFDQWDKVTVSLAPTNQVFQVSWAGNDDLI